MKNNITTIEVEGQHIAWRNELNDILKELEGFETVLTKTVATDNRMKIEHFQNQFLIQKDAISRLKNEIKKLDFVMEREKYKAFDTLKPKDLEYHKTIGQKIKTELKIIQELKNDFLDFTNVQ